jgi:hypothetical protein
VVPEGALLALVVGAAGVSRLAVGLEDGIGPLFILPAGSDWMAELVIAGLDVIIVGLEGRTVETLLVTGIVIDVVDEVAEAVRVVGPSVDTAIGELVTGLTTARTIGGAFSVLTRIAA